MNNEWTPFVRMYGYGFPTKSPYDYKLIDVRKGDDGISRRSTRLRCLQRATSSTGIGVLQKALTRQPRPAREDEGMR